MAQISEIFLNKKVLFIYNKVKLYIQGLRFKNIAPIVLLLVALTSSFIYGWYFDGSKGIAGAGWDDQSNYKLVTDIITEGNLPTDTDAGVRHYAVGYSLLGVLGKAASSSDPFMIVSLVLLLGSGVLCFLAARKVIGSSWALLFCFLLFYWHAPARVFGSASNLFTVPWNNQVFFFLMAYYFWLFTNGVDKKPTTRLLIVTGIVSGICFVTRVETIIFILPLLTSYLWLTKTSLKRWLLSYFVVGACFAPELVLKIISSGSLMDTGRGVSYGQMVSKYFDPRALHHNIWSTIIDSKHYLGTELLPAPPRRPALFQAAPWLWLSPIGAAIIVFSKRYSVFLKIFIVISCTIIIFYLAGNNMSAHKLKYHCLRYIAPGFIALNFAVTVFAKEMVLKISQWIKGNKQTTTML